VRECPRTWAMNRLIQLVSGRLSTGNYLPAYRENPVSAVTQLEEYHGGLNQNLPPRKWR
jgi:hypothetical protein